MVGSTLYDFLKLAHVVIYSHQISKKSETLIIPSAGEYVV